MDMTRMMDATMTDMPAMGMDSMAMQGAIEAMSACMQACTMCADACSGDGMERCSSMCANGADVSQAMLRMMLRPVGFDMNAMMAMLGATAEMCDACGAECMRHAETSEHCRLCAMACEEAATACRDVMMSMESMAGHA